MSSFKVAVERGSEIPADDTALAASVSKHGPTFLKDDEKWKVAPMKERKHLPVGSLSDALSGKLSAVDLSFSSVSVQIREEQPPIMSKTGSTSAHLAVDESQNLKAMFVARGAPQDISVEIGLSFDSPSKQFKVKVITIGQDGDTFKWEDWRDAFVARLEGHSKWQVAHQLPWTVTWTEGPIALDVYPVNTPMSGTGDHFQTWAGWKPFRTEFAIFELQSADFLVQVADTKTFYYEHYSWLDNDVGAADYSRELLC